MEHNVQLFEHEEFGKVRVVMIDGDPWFVANDLERILELTNIRQNLAALDDDERGVSNLYARGGTIQPFNIVNEPGLYRLIFSSRTPAAKKFQRWVYHEVLPSIRKTGAYFVNDTTPGAEFRRKVELATQKIRALVPATWNGERVLTTKQLADFFDCTDSCLKMNFHRNRDRFAEGVHFFKLMSEDVTAFLHGVTLSDNPDTDRVTTASQNRKPALYLWTKRGAACHAKSVRSEQAWRVFELLENAYFNRTAHDNNCVTLSDDTVDACHLKLHLSTKEQVDCLLKCAELTDNPKLRDALIVEAAKLVTGKNFLTD